jgi:adenine phosphoribosyltransferase
VSDLKHLIVDVPDFPKPGILFRDIGPLLRRDFNGVIDAMDALFTASEWNGIDMIGGIESRGFMLAGALAYRRGKGFVAIRKRGKLPPPVHIAAYSLEYGQDYLEVQPGAGRLLIVDDVYATGGTMQAAKTLCTDGGFSVVAIATLIDIGLNSQAHAAMGVRSAIRYA